MKTLALDLGTHTGWAARHDDGSLDSGCWDLDDDPLPNRFLALWSMLMLIQSKPKLIVIEAPIVVRNRASGARVLFGLAAVVQMYAGNFGIPCKEIPHATAKKAATGTGKAKKRQIKKTIAGLFPDQNVVSFDQADALAVLYTYECDGLPLMAAR